jgi:hypothetical protein
MLAASPAHRPSLQQCRTLPRRRSARRFISLTVGLEDFEIVLELLPAHVARMGIGNARKPVIMFMLLLHGLLAVDDPSVAPPPVHIGAGVAWVVQDTYRRRRGQRPKNSCLAVAQTRGKQKAFLTKRLDGLACRGHARERVEEMDDCLLCCLRGLVAGVT